MLPSPVAYAPFRRVSASETFPPRLRKGLGARAAGSRARRHRAGGGGHKAVEFGVGRPHHWTAFARPGGWLRLRSPAKKSRKKSANNGQAAPLLMPRPVATVSAANFLETVTTRTPWPLARPVPRPVPRISPCCAAGRRAPAALHALGELGGGVLRGATAGWHTRRNRDAGRASRIVNRTSTIRAQDPLHVPRDLQAGKPGLQLTRRAGLPPCDGDRAAGDEGPSTVGRRARPPWRRLKAPSDGKPILRH
jgi:hypothetical protein